jgi:hypothetical protein
VKNEELLKLIEEKGFVQAELMKACSVLDGKNPMSLMMNPAVLGGVFDSFKKVAAVNDRLILELAARALNGD